MDKCTVLLKLGPDAEGIRATVTESNRWKVLDRDTLARCSDVPASSWELLLTDIAESRRAEVGYCPTAPWATAIFLAFPGTEILEPFPTNFDPSVDY